jgi:IclR family pca regulon transcriptional regulator
MRYTNRRPAAAGGAERLDEPVEMAAEGELGRRETITGLARGLAVIKAFGRLGASATLAQIAQKAELHPAAARRCLNTLEELGYIGRNGRQFFLRPRILELSVAYLDAVNSEAIVRDYLQEIVAQSGHSASLSVLDGRDIVYLAHCGPRRIFRLEASVGTRYPAYATSMGRVHLAGLPDDALAEYLATVELLPLTHRTITDRKLLTAEIEKVRREGFACVEDELAIGVVAIAVPVRDRSGKTAAAINCSAQSGDVTRQDLVRKNLPTLLEIAGRMSAALPHFPGFANA